MTTKTTCLLGAILLGAVLCSEAIAERTWVCAIANAVAVDEDGTIGPPDLDGLDRPTFFRVDVDKKELTLLAPDSRRGEVTKINAIHEGEGLWFFSGVEEARSWSLVISDKGHMTLSITADGGTWSVFGHALGESNVQSGK